MDIPIYIVATFLILFFLTRITTVILHELGHATAGLILLGRQTSVYIGSYGDPEKGVHFSIGKLTIHFKYNPFLWRCGLCRSTSENSSFMRRFIFILAGPLVSLFLTLICLGLLFNPGAHGALRLVSLFLLVSSVIDFLYNIIPNKNPILLFDGTLIYNDGQSLKLLLANRMAYKNLTLLHQYYHSDQIDEGIALFNKIHMRKPYVQRLGIALNLKAGNYERVCSLFSEMSDENEFTSEDYCNYGWACSYMGDHETALALYNKSLLLNSESLYALNNRGYTLNVFERYVEAMLDFDKAISLDSQFAHAYNNRGLAKMKLGNLEDGLRDIQQSMEMDDQNAYAYKNLGIYHKEKGNLREAMKLFILSRQYDPKTDGLSELIRETEIELKGV